MAIKRQMAKNQTSFKKGHAPISPGRPVGSKNKRTILRELFRGHEQELGSDAIELARGGNYRGNKTALLLILERALPARAGAFEHLQLSDFKGNSKEKLAQLDKAFTTEKINAEEYKFLLDTLAVYSKIELECDLQEKIDNKIKELEEKLGDK